jgi:hypothetical protein
MKIYSIICLVILFLIGLMAVFFVFSKPYPFQDYREGGIELKIIDVTRNVNLSSAMGHFSKPIVYYLMNKNDAFDILPTFMIIDISQNKIHYLTTYIPENLKRLNEHKDLMIFANPNNCTPHNSVAINKDKFYAFTYWGCNFFYYVDMKSKTMRIITSKDLNLTHEVSFGSTFNKLDDSLYMSGAVQENGDYILEYYKASSDMKNIEVFFREPINDLGQVPHATMRFGNLIISSKFRGEVYTIGTESYTFYNAYNYVLLNTYNNLNFFKKEYIQILRLADYAGQILKKAWNYLTQMHGELEMVNRAALEKKNRVALKTVQDTMYDYFFGGNNFIKLLQASYNYSIIKGRITAYNLNTYAMTEYNTSDASPAHFVAYKGYLYVSVHNLAKLRDKVYFLAPAAIDKFKLTGNGLVYEKTFNDPSGYRFAAHRLFNYNGTDYLAAFGHPNRLFIVYAENMSLDYYQDIGRDYIGHANDTLQFMNNFKDDFIEALDVSDDGELLMFLYQGNINIYSVPQRKILEQVKYLPSVNITEGVNLNQFYYIHTHSDALVY